MKDSSKVQFHQRTVLLAEDTREVRLAIQAVLEDEGYAVVAANNGKDAMSKFLKHKPDVAVLDLRMPDLSGIEVCSFIRRRSDIPVLILSAISLESEKVDAFAAGADDYLVKGVGMNELLARVAGHLRRYENLVEGRNDSVEEMSAEVEPSGPKTKERTEPSSLGATILVALDDQRGRESIRDLLTKSGHTVLEAEDGETALALISVKNPKLIIIKDKLPKMNGYRVLATLRAENIATESSVIILSERGTPRDQARANVLGVSEFIVLPFVEDELEMRVGWALTANARKRRKVAEIAERERLRSEPEESAS